MAVTAQKNRPNTMKTCLAWGLAGALCLAAMAAEKEAAATNRFYPAPLEPFYQRLLASYRTNEAFGSVPRGMMEFDGVPFRMFGKIEMNGMGPTRANNFFPTRVGETAWRGCT
jgi:hypothetical protein